jgi:hypothetical protein
VNQANIEKDKRREGRRSRAFHLTPKDRDLYGRKYISSRTQRKGEYAFVLAHLELAGDENQNRLAAYPKEIWTFFRGFFALSR